jgi:hypothetical protein
MKSFFLFLVFTFVVLACCAQGNLQFNQVVNYTFSTPFAAGTSRPSETVTITVAPGKVLKIESAHLSYQSSSSTTYQVGNSSNPYGHVVLNGGVIAAFDSGLPLHQGPIWLSAGTHTLIVQGFLNSSSQFRWNAFVTGIEFNVVP